MVAKLIHWRISNMAACLVALMIALPAPLPPACGCGLANTLQKHGDQTRAANATFARKTCCDSRVADTSRSGCRPHNNARPCCCWAVPSGCDFGQCRCGPSCTCSQDQVPDPPADPVNQRNTTGKRVTATQTASFATFLHEQANASGAQTQRPYGSLDVRATSLMRCIMLSRFTL